MTNQSPNDNLPGKVSVHERWMRRALELAEKARELDEVPVGAILVRNSVIVGEGYNRREGLCDPTAHAEMIAIREAATTLRSWRLCETTLYVTLEPCLCCAGAIILGRIPRLVYGVTDPKAGAVETLYQTLEDKRLNHRVVVEKGVLADECGAILSRFFATLRNRA
jgi:tRNA(adenine34) deaminase